MRRHTSDGLKGAPHHGGGRNDIPLSREAGKMTRGPLGASSYKGEEYMHDICRGRLRSPIH